MRKQQGLSLVELLVATAITAFLMAGIVNVYIDIIETDRTQEQLSVLQQNGRFGMDMLSRDLHMAGFAGCGTKMTIAVSRAEAIANAGGAGISGTLAENDDDSIFEGVTGGASMEVFENFIDSGYLSGKLPFSSVLGWESAADSSPGTAIAALGESWTNVASTTASNAAAIAPPAGFNVVPGTDMFSVWGGTGESSQVFVNPADASLLTFADASLAEADRYYLFSDCNQTWLFQACTAAAGVIDLDAGGCSVGNTDLPPVGHAGMGMPVESYVYYVGSLAGSNRPSLFRAELQADGTWGNSVELIPGVESMQVQYGVDVDGDYSADVYASASALETNDWNYITSMKVSLLMRSLDDNIAPGSMPYRYNEAAATTPGDRRVRRVFTRVIALRNRVFF